MIDFWRKYSLFVIFVLPWIVNSQRVPACFRETSSKPGIFCTNQDLTGIDNSVYDNISPSITKNTIKRIELINCTIDNLNFLDSDYLQGVTHLYMSSLTGLRNHHLESLVPNVSLSLEQLTITKHPSLTSVDDLVNGNSNSGEWTKLEEFRVGNNGLESVTRELFAKIKSATEYDFSFNALRRLDLSAHKSVLRVKKITLNNNNLDTVDGLGDFTGLEELDLSRNRLTKVDNFATSVVGGGKLSQLDLSDNFIESFKLNGKASDEQGTLFIKLRNNRLTTISDLGSGVARNVYILDLAGNSDLQIGENTFTGLENLKELRLTSCGIPAITTHLQNLPNLSILYLDKNKIAELSRETFKGTKNVEQLWLKENNLQSLEFVSSETVRLNKLVKLDISLNRLSNLENFVAASELEELRMDGSGSTNGFTQLSACGTFTKLPTKLKIVCARDIKPNTEGSCRYHTFLNLLRSSSNKIIFNNNECCDNPTCNVSQSSYPAKQECPDKVKVCSIDTISGGVTPAPPGSLNGNSKTNCTTEVRKAFQDLYDSEKIVIAIGYILAAVFLVMVMIMFLRRYRSYDKWLGDHHERNNTMTTSSLPTHMRKSTDTLDSVDGRRGSPKLGGNGTLQKQKGYASKSFDNLSMASGYSQYSGTASKSPFMGRKKFKDANSIDMEEQSVRYTPQSQRHVFRPESGEESPTAMSVYSYASHQPSRRKTSDNATPPSERRRHRSGGAVQRLKSSDLLNELMRCDEDIVPPRVQVVLQRKATERKSGSNSIHRNSRAYGTAPYRTKVKSGIVKKSARSPMLTVNKLHRHPGAQRSSMIKRALPDPPLDSSGSIESPMLSVSSFASNKSKLSNSSQMKNDVFGEEESEYNETEHLTVELDNEPDLLDMS